MIIRTTLIVVALVAAGCSGAEPSPTTEPGPVDAQGRRAYSLLTKMASGRTEEAIVAFEAVREEEDPRYVAALIELLRADQIGIVPRVDAPYLEALEELSGESFGNDWLAWVEWYSNTDLEPPPQFDRWKSDLLARLDPRFRDFIHAGVPSEIRLEEIQWGGVQVDGIPALDDPKVTAPAEASYLTGEEPVFGVVVEGQARAYPLRILDWHEMVNDSVGDVRFSLAYCTLCGSAVAYVGELDGEPLTFGSSGLLHNSNKLMYDRVTHSLWAQFTGRPVVGELVGAEIDLQRIPVVLSRWSDWQQQHPSTTVLDVNTGFDRPYELGAAYGDYFFGGETIFPVGDRSDGLETKTRIFGLDLNGRQRAYPVALLAERGVVNDKLGGLRLVIVADRGTARVAATERPEDKGDIFYEAGGEVRAFEAGRYRFASGGKPGRLTDQDGAVWKVTEDALEGPEGHRLERLLSQDAFWFAWFSYFRNTSVFN